MPSSHQSRSLPLITIIHICKPPQHGYVFVIGNNPARMPCSRSDSASAAIYSYLNDKRSDYHAVHSTAYDLRRFPTSILGAFTSLLQAIISVN